MRYVEIVDRSFRPLMGNVTCGQFFKYNDELCVRTSKNTSGQWEAFGFASHEKFWIPHTDRVQLVDCKIEYNYIDAVAAEVCEGRGSG